MNLIKPKKLKKSDTIGLLSVSGEIREPQRIEKAKEYFEKLGYNVVISPTTHEKNRYMAGSDEARLNALHSFFEDDSIDAIVCTRGGYGAIRLINDIDYDLVRRHPKIFAGYSDISALLAMFYKRTGLVTFHSPMANGDFGADEVDNFTEKSFFDFMITDVPFYKAQDGFKIYYEGIGEGVLWGGNLATINSLAGIDFVPDEKFILFIEDLNEPVYKIDKMLTQLWNIEKFRDNINGVVLGKFTDVDNKEFLDEFFVEFSQKLKKPMLDGFLISHETRKITLPVGIRVQLDSGCGVLKFLENSFV